MSIHVEYFNIPFFNINNIASAVKKGTVPYIKIIRISTINFICLTISGALTFKIFL
jgi:hypothetical protein